MARSITIAAASFVLAALVSGCTMPDQSPASSAPSTTSTGTAGVVADANTYSITLTNFAGLSSPQLTQADNFTLPVVASGKDFNFTERIDGTPVLHSDHVGGHFGANASASPSTSTYPLKCAHNTDAKLPGIFTITCTAVRPGANGQPSTPLPPGTYHLRGHARITQNGADVNWWSADLAFRVV